MTAERPDYLHDDMIDADGAITSTTIAPLESRLARQLEETGRRERATYAALRRQVIMDGTMPETADVHARNLIKRESRRLGD